MVTLGEVAQITEVEIQVQPERGVHTGTETADRAFATTLGEAAGIIEVGTQVESERGV